MITHALNAYPNWVFKLSTAYNHVDEHSTRRRCILSGLRLPSAAPTFGPPADCVHTGAYIHPPTNHPPSDAGSEHIDKPITFLTLRAFLHTFLLSNTLYIQNKIVQLQKQSIVHKCFLQFLKLNII